MPLQSKSVISESKRVTVSFSDSINLANEQVQWTPKGVCLLTKWRFAEGVEVEFAFDHQGERHCCSGVVVACHPLKEPQGCFETILYFVDTPCSKLQKAACDCNLAKDGHVPAKSDEQVVSRRAKVSRS
jgi:hypothetical protein